MPDRVNTINEYTDDEGKSPYADWLASLRDASHCVMQEPKQRSSYE